MAHAITTASIIPSVEGEEEPRADTHILVYSPLATDERVTPDRAKVLYRRACGKRPIPREKYPLLPWMMGDLVGTTWRNVHTGSPTEVVAIEKDRWHNPQLCIQSSYAWGAAIPWRLGLWTNDLHRNEGRYVIEHWVRVDHFSAEDQLPWFYFRLDRIQAQIASDTEQFAECARVGDRVNARLREQDLKRDQRELAYAEMQLHAFRSRTK